MDIIIYEVHGLRMQPKELPYTRQAVIEYMRVIYSKITQLKKLEVIETHIEKSRANKKQNIYECDRCHAKRDYQFDIHTNPNEKNLLCGGYIDLIGKKVGALAIYNPPSKIPTVPHILREKEAIKILGGSREDIERLPHLDKEGLEELVHKLMRQQVRNYHPDIHPQYSELFKEKTEAYERLKHLIPKHRSLEERDYADAMLYT